MGLINMSHRVFISSSSFAEYDQKPLKILQGHGLIVTANSIKKRLNRQQLIEQAKGADAVIAGLEIYDAQVLEHLKDLRCISRCGVGVDNIDLTAAQAKGIKIFITPDAVVQPVVEFTLALILNLLRKVTRHNVYMNQRQWQRLMGSQLAGKTVGVIGLGRIGRKVAEALLSLGAQVVGYDIYPDKAWCQTRGVPLLGRDQILGLSDILSLHLAADAQNPFVLTKQDFQSMKKGALLINVARGVFIDEMALLEALQEGQLSGAGLDVYVQEPYTGPLCDLDNVILTPHIATLTQESRLAMEIEAAQNLVNFFNK